MAKWQAAAAPLLPSSLSSRRSRSLPRSSSPPPRLSAPCAWHSGVPRHGATVRRPTPVDAAASEPLLSPGAASSRRSACGRRDPSCLFLAVGGGGDETRRLDLAVPHPLPLLPRRGSPPERRRASSSSPPPTLVAPEQRRASQPRQAPTWVAHRRGWPLERRPLAWLSPMAHLARRAPPTRQGHRRQYARPGFASVGLRPVFSFLLLSSSGRVVMLRLSSGRVVHSWVVPSLVV